MKLTQLLNMQTPIQTIIDQRIPFGLAYKFTKAATIIEENQKFYTDSLHKLLKDYAQIDENGQYKLTDNGQGVLIKPEFMSEFNEKLAELDSLEVDVELPKFTLAEIEDKVEITPRDLYPLMCLFED